MKSSKPRKIVLSDQQLIQIRANLRIILKLSFSTRLKRWIRVDNLYREKYLNGKITPSQKQRWFFLSHRFGKLSSAYYKSILNCISGAACLSLRDLNNNSNNESVNSFETLNMVWLPCFRAWSCVKCFDEYYKGCTHQDYSEYGRRSMKFSKSPLDQSYSLE